MYLYVWYNFPSKFTWLPFITIDATWYPVFAVILNSFVAPPATVCCPNGVIVPFAVPDIDDVIT